MRPLLARLAPAALAVALVASCANLPPEPRHQAELAFPWGTASGATVEEAAGLGRMVETARSSLTAYEGFEDDPLRIHMVERIGDHEDIAGVRVSSGDDAYVLIERGASNVPQTVAHELVHHYFHRLFDAFPGVVEEGTCVYLGDRVVPDPGARRRRLMPVALGYLDEFTLEVSGTSAKATLPELLRAAPTLPELLELDSNQLFAADRHARNLGYGLGLILVERIGFPGLVALAERTRRAGRERVPLAELLEAARLEAPLGESLERAILEALGLDVRRGRQKLTLRLESAD